MNTIFFEDKDGKQRVFRTQKPRFLGTIIDGYTIYEGNSSPSVNGRKIGFDEIFDEIPDSKLNWSAKKALKDLAHQEQKEEEDEATKAFEFVKRNRKFLNLSAIEEECGIKRTSLTTAVNRDQKTFRDAEKLVQLISTMK